MFPVAGKAMQDSTQSGGPPVFLNHLDGVVPGILAVVTGPAVDHNRQFGGFSQPHLPAKDFFLHLAW